MGRPKNYDRDAIARKAMEVFWRYGYHGTSTQALVDAMGVNRFSVYAEFGNKQALYELSISTKIADSVGSIFINKFLFFKRAFKYAPAISAVTTKYSNIKAIAR